MKKILVLLVAIFALIATSNAQRALGMRLGGGSGYGGEFSFQKDLSSANRLEFDLGFISDRDYHDSGIALCGIYQWVWDLSELSEGFKWYAGPGVGIRSFAGVGVGVLGQIGIEYTLQDFPLQFSLDARPDLFSGGYNGFGYGAALGIRYKF